MTETRAARPRSLWTSLALAPVLALAFAGPSPAQGAPEEPSRAGPNADAHVEGGVPPPEGPWGHDPEGRVAATAAFPSYGGHYITDDGVLVLLMTDYPNVSVEEAHALRSALALFPGELPYFGVQVPERDIEQFEQLPVEVRKAEYRYADLNMWYGKLFGDIVGVEGWTGSSVDHQYNRITIDFDESKGDEAAFRAVVERANVPQGAVVLRASGPALGPGWIPRGPGSRF